MNRAKPERQQSGMKHEPEDTLKIELTSKAALRRSIWSAHVERRRGSLIALTAVVMTSLAACSANKRVGDMETTRNRPVARLTEAAVRNHEELFPGHESKLKETDPDRRSHFSPVVKLS